MSHLGRFTCNKNILVLKSIISPLHIVNRIVYGVYLTQGSIHTVTETAGLLHNKFACYPPNFYLFIKRYSFFMKMFLPEGIVKRNVIVQGCTIFT